MLFTTKQLLDVAYKNKFAIPSFNVNNLEMIQGIFRAASETDAPIIVQTAAEEIGYGGGNTLFELIQSVASQFDVPYAIHLDHGPDFSMVVSCLRRGYTSVMFDGSALPFEDNVAQTRRVTDAAHAVGVSVEAELGKLGGLDEMGSETGTAMLTDPLKAEEFVARTGIDLFAPAIGTAHGFYRGEPRLDFPRLEEIANRTDLPLVMHGGSGIPEKMIHTAIGYGIAKINFSTSLRKAFLDTIRSFMKQNPDNYMTIDIFEPATEALKQSARGLIEMCKTNNKKALYHDLEA